MPPETAIVQANGLTKQFGRLTALRSVSLQIAGGEFMTIFGRNGAGKTTLLKILASLIRSYTGDVVLFGKDLKDGDEEVRRHIGFIGHESFIYGDMTVHDNLRFYARLYGISNSSQRIGDLISRVELEAKTRVPARALSRGMKQRLSLARAFLHEPDLMLLDEPYTGLDERGCEFLDGFLAGVIGGGGTVVMTTHDLERGWNLASRVAILERGALLYESTVRETTLGVFRKTYSEILSH